MIRAPLGDQGYWDTSVLQLADDIADRIATLKLPAGDPAYTPQYSFNLCKQNWHLMLARYSRGDNIFELTQYFRPLLDAWEQAERLGATVWTDAQKQSRRSWRVNLDHYIICFWLVGLALALDIPDDQWQRLLALIGNEGEDAVLDRIIASRQSGRRIGAELCHPKPYQRLLDAINAPYEKKARQLQEFVSHWYKELNRSPKKGLSEQTAMYDRPYWYTYGNQNFEGGAYFGRWCIEAVAAVKAFGLDDSLCLGHEHYPGDLLRPQGPSMHRPRETLEPSSITAKPAAGEPIIEKSKSTFLSRLFGKR
jgi:Domain of unknown function (DUF1911)/Domain of unknown function (DUF1910)